MRREPTEHPTDPSRGRGAPKRLSCRLVSDATTGGETYAPLTMALAPRGASRFRATGMPGSHRAAATCDTIGSISDRWQAAPALDIDKYENSPTTKRCRCKSRASVLADDPLGAAIRRCKRRYR